MFGRQNPQGSRPLDSIDFELTNLSEARRALDEPPAGVQERRQLEPGYWEQRRRKPVATDRALTGMAMEWLIGLPAAVRPRAMCESFPRIVNLICASWADPAQAQRTLRRLLEDERGGRKGFPQPVEQEIRALASYHASAVPPSSLAP